MRATRRRKNRDPQARWNILEFRDSHDHSVFLQPESKAGRGDDLTRRRREPREKGLRWANPCRRNFSERSRPFSGPSTKKAVERTSAVSPEDATTVADPKSGAGRPVRGSRRWPTRRPRIRAARSELPGGRDRFVFDSRAVTAIRRRSRGSATATDARPRRRPGRPDRALASRTPERGAPTPRGRARSPFPTRPRRCPRPGQRRRSAPSRVEPEPVAAGRRERPRERRRAGHAPAARAGPRRAREAMTAGSKAPPVRSDQSKTAAEQPRELRVEEDGLARAARC